MYSPNHLLFSNHLYIFGELLQKQAAEARRKGVVGKIGSTIPIAPKTRQIMPMLSHSALEILWPAFLSTRDLHDFSSFISGSIRV